MAKPIQKTKKYRPNLSSLMNLCDINYMLLLRLLSDKEHVGDVRRFYISDFLSYRIEIKEVTRYTSLVTMSQDTRIYEIKHGHNTSNVKKLYNFLSPKMDIRLYHDARMAEVISNQDVRQVKPRYDYPNYSMHLPDEKQQINVFLKDWLQLSLQLGQAHVACNGLLNDE